jgi:FkbM family methyltransferase
VYKRLGIIHLGRRRVRDLIDFVEDRQIDVVIDVGANVGQFGESLRQGGYRGRLVSFEPVESVYQTLASKVASDSKWEVHHCGLGATSGSAKLHVSELSVFSSILDMTSAAGLHDSRMAVDHVEEIPIRTLDEVASGLSGRIFLKIDTQGYERQVIEGGPQTIRRSLGILMELPIIHVYEGEWQFHEALKFMEEMGFVPAQIQPVGFHGKDKVAAVEFDCLFRPLSQVDGPLSVVSG